MTRLILRGALVALSPACSIPAQMGSIQMVFLGSSHETNFKVR
jgi:hypothetical protein